MTEKKTAVSAPEKKLIGFELKPSEVAVHLETGNARVTHIFSRLLDRGERINITAAAAQQEFKGDEIILDAGDSDAAYKNAWDNMIKAVEGYRLGGQPASLEAARDRIYTQHKRAAIDGTNQVRVRRDDGLDEEIDLDACDESTVILEAQQGAETHEIEFGFRRPLDNAELRKLQQRGMRFKQAPGGGLIVGSKDSLRQIEELFDQLIESVEGYLVEGVPIIAVPEWPREVPIDHKALAVGELRRRATARLSDPN